MGYPGYDAKTKLEIVKQIWKGAKVAPLSRRFGISRDSIHRWINEAEEGALKSVSPSAPGPKVDPLVHLKEENEHLNSLVQKLQDELEALSQVSQITVSTKAPSLLEERPSKCPECGATRIWKNGTYQVKGERTSRSLIVKGKGTVQRFRCSHCGIKLYLVKKNQNEEIEKIEIHLEEAILTDEPLKNVFSFKEKVISLERVELSSNLGSSSKSSPLFRVILAKRLDLYIEKEKSYLSQAYLKEALSEKKTLFFESVNSQESIQINIGLDEFAEILPSGFLAILASFAKSLSFFDPFLKHFYVSMKEVKYSIMDKIATLFSSIAVGSSHIKDINQKLTPYPLAASLFGMDRFPDQSQINRFLNRMGPEQIIQLSLVFEAILGKVILFKDNQKVDLNVDATGLVVYGDKYQFAKKGYFPHQRGKEGYQLSLGTTNCECSQILSLILDPGDIALNMRLWDTIYEAAEVLGSLERIGIIRADAIYGTGADIAELIEQSLSFLIKGRNPLTAKKILKEANPSYDDWKPVDETTWAFDAKYVMISGCPYPVRTVITKGVDAKGKLNYRHIYTSFPPKEMDEVETALSYKKRIDIEAIIRDDKYGLYIDNLRTKNFWGIWAYLFMACATHNLISLFRDRVLRGTGIEDLGIQTVVKKLADIPAKFEKEQNKMRIFFPAGHELARRFIQGKQDNHKSSIFPLEKKLYN